MSSEIWLPVKGFPNYVVSSLGRVRNRKGLLSMHTRPDGYIMVNLYREGKQHSFRVNRLVCEAFNGDPPDPELLALHKNHVRSDNTPGNLYWGTQARNMADRLEAGRGNFTKGEEASWSKLNWEKVREIRQKRKEGSTYALLSSEYNVAILTIRDVCIGKNWKE